MGKVVMVVAAHPDDEALGCGGTIARHADSGNKVQVVFMADGVGARKDGGPDKAKKRVEAAERAAEILGITKTHYLGFPDNQMDSLPLIDIVQPLEEIIRKIRPDIIYTHHYGDLNVDHRITHQAVMTACRPQPGFPVKEIYAFEVLSSTEWQTPGVNSFVPNCYENIEGYVRTKIKALEAYGEEMRGSPHSRSIQGVTALAEHRGFSVGFPFAEAFNLIRHLR